MSTFPPDDNEFFYKEPVLMVHGQRLNGPAPKESTIVAAILKYLNGLPHCIAIKTHGSAYSVVGTPDIVGCYWGKAFAFEVKRPGNKPTAIQKHALDNWLEAKAYVGVVTSVEEVKNLLHGFLD